MQLFPRSILAALAARFFAALPADPHAAAHHVGGSALVGGRPFLPRGQAAARGIVIGPSLGSRPKKSTKREDIRLRRAILELQARKLRPDFSAQIAAEAKQARGRAARAARMGG